MNREDELLDELQRLHRRGLINDQEAIDLKRLLRKTKDRPKKRVGKDERINYDNDNSGDSKGTVSFE